jgi:hypothetical protein
VMIAALRRRYCEAKADSKSDERRLGGANYHGQKKSDLWSELQVKIG